jgi:hypothetical protein
MVADRRMRIVDGLHLFPCLRGYPGRRSMSVHTGGSTNKVPRNTELTTTKTGKKQARSLLSHCFDSSSGRKSIPVHAGGSTSTSPVAQNLRLEDGTKYESLRHCPQISSAIQAGEGCPYKQAPRNAGLMTVKLKTQVQIAWHRLSKSFPLQLCSVR